MDRKKNPWKSLAQPSEACLDLEAFDDYLGERVDDSTRAKIADHLSDCPRCMTELALLSRFESAVPKREEEKDVDWIVAQLKEHLQVAPGPSGAKGSQDFSSTKSRDLFPRLRSMFSYQPARLALAGAALLVMLAAGVLWHDSRDLPIAPIETGTLVLRSEQIEIVFPIGDVNRAPMHLEWQSVPTAAWYEASILEVDRVVLWKGETRRTRISIPEEVQARIIPGKKLLWEVRALDESDQPIASSDLVDFRIVFQRRN